MITKEQLTKITSIQQNVNPEQLMPYISIAEDLHLRSILGEALYNEFRSAFESGDMDTRYANLYEYVVPVLAYFAFYEYLPFSLFKITNRGLEKRSGVESDSATIVEVNALRSTVRSFADNYQAKLEAFIKNNLASYPLYSVNCNDDKSNRGIGGLYIY